MTGPDDFLIEPTLPIAAATAAGTSGPPPSSDAPGPVQEPLDQPGTATRQPDEVEDPFEPKEFDERCKEPFSGLLYLGALEETVTVWGHSFRLVTPSQAERLQMGQLHKPFADTLASEIAYQTLMVASFLLEVDRQPLPQPVVNDVRENAVRDRFRWVSDNLRPPVIDELFSSCLALESEVRRTLEAMGEA